jgi:capsular polysaccharide export protein
VTQLHPRRRFLFLQGVPGPFLHSLAMTLSARGHAVFRINVNGGDRRAWPVLQAVDYGGDLSGWPGFLSRHIAAHQVTDIVLFGDCRKLHAIAIHIARRAGIAVHVFEEGYLRPGFITLELGGVNGHSRVPKDPALFLAAAEALPTPPDPPHRPPSLTARARDYLGYAAACLVQRHRFPHYQTHRGQTLPREGLSRMRRALGRYAARRRGRNAMRRINAAAGGVFVLPLQLHDDAQVLCHAPDGGMTGALETIIASFAGHAPADAVLAVKEHPLDDGAIVWRDIVAAMARRAGIAERVILIEACDLSALLRGARGMVTVNSTSATVALARGIPVKAVGRAVYDLPGLTHQGTLDGFWRAPAHPCPRLFGAFRKALAQTCLIEGDFFNRDGITRAVTTAANRLETPRDAAARMDAIIRHHGARTR